MRTLKEIDRDIADVGHHYLAAKAKLKELHDEREQAQAIDRAERRMASLCDEVIRRFLRGEWIAGSGGRLYWCSDRQPGALIEPATADDMEAADYLVAQGVLATGFKGGPR